MELDSEIQESEIPAVKKIKQKSTKAERKA